MITLMSWHIYRKRKVKRRGEVNKSMITEFHKFLENMKSGNQCKVIRRKSYIIQSNTYKVIRTLLKVIVDRERKRDEKHE